MPYVIAIAGKGGVGKTTLAAALVKYLLKKAKPVLAVDADPNSNLGQALGLDYKETVADIREEVKKKTPESFSKSEFFSLRLEEAVIEGDGFDLLVMGRPEGPGCYCSVNNILRDYLAKIAKNYKFVVIDNEAGMEHLSRRTAGEIDLLLIISDTTMAGIRSAIKVSAAAKDAGLKIKAESALINKSRSVLGPDKLKLLRGAGLNIGGYLPFDTGIEKDSEEGKPVSGMPEISALDNIFGGT